MAVKRMFSMKIVDSDAFLDMPMTTQCLYFHLNMRADDDGFVGNPKRIQRLIGASDDDLKLLIAKRFVLCFDSGVIVIKHWRMHNTIRKDRYTRTVYIDELNSLVLKENNSYTDNIIENGNQMATKRVTSGGQTVSTGLGLGLGIDIDMIDECTDVLFKTTNPVTLRFKNNPFFKGEDLKLYDDLFNELLKLYHVEDINVQVAYIIDKTKDVNFKNKFGYLKKALVDNLSYFEQKEIEDILYKSKSVKEDSSNDEISEEKIREYMNSL